MSELETNARTFPELSVKTRDLLRTAGRQMHTTSVHPNSANIADIVVALIEGYDEAETASTKAAPATCHDAKAAEAYAPEGC